MPTQIQAKPFLVSETGNGSAKSEEVLGTTATLDRTPSAPENSKHQNQNLIPARSVAAPTPPATPVTPSLPTTPVTSQPTTPTTSQTTPNSHQRQSSHLQQQELISGQKKSYSEKPDQHEADPDWTPPSSRHDGSLLNLAGS